MVILAVEQRTEETFEQNKKINLILEKQVMKPELFNEQFKAN